jgi:predicted amidophosphoribosyltransferase
MATVKELSELLERSMQNPAPPGPGICPRCRGFPNEGYTLDYGCGHTPDHLDALVAISYEPEGGQLHTALRGYKDDPRERVRAAFRRQLAAVLWRFLHRHEACLAAAAGAPAFGVVAVVPSKTSAADAERGQLRKLVGETCRHTAERFEALACPTDRGSAEREFDHGRFAAVRRLDAEHVLLVDDTWTTGASAQSAAWALKQAGAATVALVAIGRYVKPDWPHHAERLAALPQGFRWDTCALHR